MQRHMALIADRVLVHSGQTGNDFDLLSKYWNCSMADRCFCNESFVKRDLKVFCKAFHPLWWKKTNFRWKGVKKSMEQLTIAGSRTTLENCQRESFFDNDLEQSYTSKRGNEFLVEKLTLERVWVAAYALKTSKANKYQVTGMMWWFLVELSLVTDCDRGLTQRPDPLSLNCLMVSIATWASSFPSL